MGSERAGANGTTGKKSLELLAKVIRYVNTPQSKDLPERVEFNDPDRSWQVFVMLESMADGMGAWRFMDVLGEPLMKLPESLTQDLLTWRWLAGIVRHQNDLIEQGKDPFAIASPVNFEKMLRNDETTG